LAGATSSSTGSVSRPSSVGDKAESDNNLFEPEHLREHALSELGGFGARLTRRLTVRGEMSGYGTRVGGARIEAERRALRTRGSARVGLRAMVQRQLPIEKLSRSDAERGAELRMLLERNEISASKRRGLSITVKPLRWIETASRSGPER
jgi:hypothetical protein